MNLNCVKKCCEVCVYRSKYPGDLHYNCGDCKNFKNFYRNDCKDCYVSVGLIGECAWFFDKRNKE